MIKPQELRIGNYIEINKTVEQVEAIEWNEIDGSYDIVFNNKCSDIDIVICKPIPLTEEWLIKLGGWVSFSDKNYSDVYIVENKDLCVTIENGEVSINVTFKNHKIEIKYVHELQNLYFALTGEELCTHTTTE